MVLGDQVFAPPVLVTIEAEKPPVATAESTVWTIGSAVVAAELLSTEVLLS